MTSNYSKILLEISHRTRYDYEEIVSGEVYPFWCKELENMGRLRGIKAVQLCLSDAIR